MRETVVVHQAKTLVLIFALFPSSADGMPATPISSAAASVTEVGKMDELNFRDAIRATQMFSDQ